MVARNTDVGKNCIDCKDRYVGCHSSCEKYKSASEEWERQRAEARKKKLDDAIYWSTHCRNVKNNRKGKK